MKLRTLAALAVLIAAPALHAQTVTVDVAPGQVQGFAITGPARISYDAKQVVVTLGASPAPTPTPTPVDPPAPPPVPTPVAEWGPPAKIVILYESSALTGREPWYTPDFLDAVDSLVGKTGRIYVDKDLPVTRADWSDLAAKAKAEHKGATDPALYAFDAKGRIKAVPLKNLSPENATAAVKAMGVVE